MTILDVQRPREAGFTLVEMLVVIGIILVLLGILVPTTLNMLRSGERSRVSYQIQILDTGVRAYVERFRSAPRANEPVSFVAGTNSPPRSVRRGGAVLTRWLVGNGPESVDGIEGPGYRLPSRTGQPDTGDEVQALIRPDVFRYRQLDRSPGNPGSYTPPANTVPESTWVLVDASDNFILYYARRSRVANIFGTGTPYVATGTSTTSVWYSDENDDLAAQSASDNTIGTAAVPAGDVFEMLLGDTDANGTLNSGEAPTFTGDWIIMSPGPARSYPTGSSVNERKANIERSTIVTNFRQ